MQLEERNSIRKAKQLISFSCSGSFQHIDDFFKRMKNVEITDSIVKDCAQEGVRILSENTPKLSGRTASSWDYEIENNGGDYTIRWINTNINRNVNIAVILQYGHGTRHGGYVHGIDYINPSTQEIFIQMINRVWGEVTKV